MGIDHGRDDGLAGQVDPLGLRRILDLPRSANQGNGVSVDHERPVFDGGAISDDQPCRLELDRPIGALGHISGRLLCWARRARRREEERPNTDVHPVVHRMPPRVPGGVVEVLQKDTPRLRGAEGAEIGSPRLDGPQTLCYRLAIDSDRACDGERVAEMAVRVLLWVLLCGSVGALVACRVIDWEDYMEAGYDAHQEGRYGEAEDMFLAAVQRAEGFRPDDPRRATTFDNLADVYRGQSRNTEAETFYRRALEIRTRALGPDHPRLAVSLANLASFYSDQGSYTDAEPLYWRAAAISEETFGPNHQDVAASVAGLAALYHYQDQYADAEPLYQQALNVLEATVGPEDIRVAEVLEGYAEMLRKIDRAGEAEAMEARARSIRPEP